MADRIFDRFRAIDTDTHITEPPDVWTARVASKWGDMIPHVKRLEGRDIWCIKDQMIGGPGWTTMAGFNGSFPDSPLGYDDIPKSSFDAKERLAHMDAEGIHAQVLYPNVGGFGGGGFLKLGEPELMLDCVRAYNDFLVDWCSADPNRLVPVAAMPFWDVDACIAEIHRAAQTGHKAILAGSVPEDFGEPPLCSKHWDPFWAAANEVGLPISFHIGAGDITDLLNDKADLGTRLNFARVSSLIFMQNVKCLADLIFGGICHRFPNLKMVSVESGVGWIQSYLEAADWQFINSEVRKEHPEMDLLPSEYFKRQIYGCFWFEEDGLEGALKAFPDNIMWETDYPHPTCQHPSPVHDYSQHPADYAEKVFADVPDDITEKVLNSTASELYGLN
ncbi:MAG: amidohydrolase family protein [Myxococcota bacterium]|nr:amidohydrolase family protein [Myxococcota bacterium]